ncbi:hypothetical protein Agub_g4567 [Astrephomene gubernaculifera]|uniref:CL1 n=1 Tax=Astrephomene gubernaculifera TaxID=47775 RepID=A0AAD3DKF2_9CHLO|nr:hypothetical protein Agub_g4567 [Astrephomene gubernaculifera]
MASMLARRACCNSTSLLLEQLPGASETLLAQVSRWERCFSGACASTSSGTAAWPATQLFAGIRWHSQSASAGAPSAAASPALSAASQAVSIAQLPHRGLSTSALTASAAAASPAVVAATAEAAAGASTSSSSNSSLQAPWPFIDPAKPQVLPVAVPRTRRTPQPLNVALQQLLGPLRPGQRASHALEVFVRFSLDPRRSDHLVRGSVVLPYGTGKKVRLVVFAKGADADIARQEGVDLIGDEELISAIVSSEGAAITFDKLIATPDFMRPLARAGKVLGPKGLMPNPKMGTLTTDVAKAIRETRRGRLDYRLGRDATVRAALGRTNMPYEHLSAHVGGLVASLLENKPKALGGPVGAAVGAAGGAGAAVGGAVGGEGVATGGAAATAAAAGLEGYVRTFLLKTTKSAPVAVTFESLGEAVQAYRNLVGGAAAAAGGAAAEQQDQQQQPKKQ